MSLHKQADLLKLRPHVSLLQHAAYTVDYDIDEWILQAVKQNRQKDVQNPTNHTAVLSETGLIKI